MLRAVQDTAEVALVSIPGLKGTINEIYLQHHDNQKSMKNNNEESRKWKKTHKLSFETKRVNENRKIQ